MGPGSTVFQRAKGRESFREKDDKQQGVKEAADPAVTVGPQRAGVGEVFRTVFCSVVAVEVEEQGQEV